MIHSTFPFLGIEGAGKNVFTNAICEALRPYCLENLEMSSITGRFNSIACGKQLVVINEVETAGTGASTERAMNKLKMRSTEKVLTMEEKYVKAIVTENTANYIVLSNSTQPVSLSVSDRRFFVARVSGKFLVDGDFFTSLQHYITSHKDFHRHILTFFLSRDITNFKPTIIPMTEEKKELIRTSMNPFSEWVEGYLDVLTSKKGLTYREAMRCRPPLLSVKTFQSMLNSCCDPVRVRGTTGQYRIYKLLPEYEKRYKTLGDLNS